MWIWLSVLTLRFTRVCPEHEERTSARPAARDTIPPHRIACVEHLLGRHAALTPIQGRATEQRAMLRQLARARTHRAAMGRFVMSSIEREKASAMSGLEAYTKQLIDLAREHQTWGMIIVFWLAFGESLAFISLLLPATVILVGIGAVAVAGDIAFWPICIAAALGAALGDWLSYWIGQKVGPRVNTIWPLSRHPDLLPRGETFIKKYGIYAIFLGRFFGPLRASVPLAAGILSMKHGPFQLANFSSAAVWAFLLLKAGDVGLQVFNWMK
jgi:membrane protein DedA with SNARE-associated domain